MLTDLSLGLLRTSTFRSGLKRELETMIKDATKLQAHALLASRLSKPGLLVGEAASHKLCC